MRVETKTKLYEELFEVRSTLFDYEDNEIQKIAHVVVNTTEKHIKEGLISLGWTPPGEYELNQIEQLQARVKDLEQSLNSILSLIYNNAISNVAMGRSVDIEAIAEEVFKITGISAEQVYQQTK